MDALYYLGNARSEKQKQEMVALQAAGICIFCPDAYSRVEEREVLLEYPGGVSLKKQVLFENSTWAVLRNEYPYPGTSRHVMLVPKEHVTRQDQLSPVAQDGYWEILRAAAARFGPDYYALGSRNGEMRFTAATIAHVHIQFIVGDPDNQGDPVMLFVSSRPDTSPSSA